jgi:hypothetical protein
MKNKLFITLFLLIAIGFVIGATYCQTVAGAFTFIMLAVMAIFCGGWLFIEDKLR